MIADARQKRKFFGVVLQGNSRERVSHPLRAMSTGWPDMPPALIPRFTWRDDLEDDALYMVTEQRRPIKPQTSLNVSSGICHGCVHCLLILVQTASFDTSLTSPIPLTVTSLRDSF